MTPIDSVPQTHECVCVSFSARLFLWRNRVRQMPSRTKQKKTLVLRLVGDRRIVSETTTIIMRKKRPANIIVEIVSQTAQCQTTETETNKTRRTSQVSNIYRTNVISLYRYEYSYS